MRGGTTQTQFDVVEPFKLTRIPSLKTVVDFRNHVASLGIELPCEVQIGRNFVIDHFGGIIISGYAKFGNDCRIRNGVVVGLRRVGEASAPIIGNNVDIGSGAKLLGPIRVGDNVVIGANAVVLCHVLEDCVAVGVPATVRQRRVPDLDTNRV